MVDTRSKWIMQIKDEETNNWRNMTKREVGYSDAIEYLTESNAQKLVDELHHDYRSNLMNEMADYAGIKRGRDRQLYQQSKRKVLQTTYRYIEGAIGA